MADLEADGLLSSWSAPSTAGSTRHVYDLTSDGYACLGQWMAVVEDGQLALSGALKRYSTVLDRPSEAGACDNVG